MTTTFVPGLALARALYEEAVRPVLDDFFPGLIHSAALLGSGSEVLGYDTQRSTDHDWGPRVQLFMRPADARRHGRAVEELLAQRLPASVAGWSTNFTPPVPGQSRALEPAGGGPVRHRVEVLDLDAWLVESLGVDLAAGHAHGAPSGKLGRGLRTVDWLAVPSQRLLAITAGAVFHDGLGQLEPIRQSLAWYPDDVWRYLLAAQWGRIAEEEAFPGRCAEVGDELGSRVVTARLVRDAMRLALLLERRYAPYSKWLGTAFAGLSCAPALQPLLHAAIEASTWPAREEALCGTYEALAGACNDLGLAEPIDPTCRPFWDRPFRVLGADRFADGLRHAIVDATVRALPAHVGGVDQIVDSTHVLTHAARSRAAATSLLAPPTPDQRDGRS